MNNNQFSQYSLSLLLLFATIIDRPSYDHTLDDVVNSLQYNAIYYNSPLSNRQLPLPSIYL